ncbi:hypothetical protein D4764_11G0007420 [Takifugu flavidus]|uniref:Immunoglobulin V-set domain-containing protein n=1 Tax=Takifugu flavidus TaxID=433684 RepID=A0A5C6PIB0_9TELE|nr:hypothetical protein D4764_11G0007420 [Takifugu flavidus]
MEDKQPSNVTIRTLDKLNGAGVFTVTMSGLKMEDSGWYWCSRGDLQMPVQIIVREKPSTTAQPETFTSPELVSPSTTNEAEKPSTTDETEKPSTTDEAEKPSTTDEDAPNRLQILICDCSHVTGVYSVTTVTKVSVKAGDSVSIPCLYDPNTPAM